MRSGIRAVMVTVIGMLAIFAATGQGAAAAPSPGPAVTSPAPGSTAATPIDHFVFLMQGDRSFDNYFGKYPGADGIPASACQNFVAARPAAGCVAPFPGHGGGTQQVGAGTTEIARQYNKGKMDGFVSALQAEGRDGAAVMGYYDQRDVGTYWDLANRYVLFDRFFSSTRAGETANRSYWVAGSPPPIVAGRPSPGSDANQLTIFDRLQAAGISWKFYVQDYNPQQTFRAVSKQIAGTQPTRVPLLTYARFVDDSVLNSHIVDLDQYYQDLNDGTLPAVAYIASSGASERSARSIPAGQKLVTGLVGQLMLSKYWQSSAFLWSYDGTGGWYDHVAPPQVDRDGYGLRVPALLVSAYARRGQVDHTVLDYTSALAFVEKNWKLAPLATRDASANSLSSAFDFTAPPRPPQLHFGEPATQAPLKSVAIVYWCYGGAAGLALGLLLFAVTRAAFVERRRRINELLPRSQAAAPVAVAEASTVGAETP